MSNLEQPFLQMKVAEEVVERGEDRSTEGSEGAYVLVLIDGHTHSFQKKLLCDSMLARGSKAIDALSLAMSQILHVSQNCKVVISGYRCRGEQRHLSSFFEACVDPQSVELKVEERLLAALSDPQCKHIFLAAWGKPTYISIFTTQHKEAEKVTLIQGSNFGLGFEKLPLCYETVSFPHVFLGPTLKDSFAYDLAASGAIAVYLKIRGKTGVEVLRISTSLPQFQKLNPLQNSFPPRSKENSNIPLNAKDQRLDFYLNKPLQSTFNYYDKRETEPCLKHYFNRPCDKEECDLDHSRTNSQVSHVLQWSLRKTPCTYGSECRHWRCPYAHVCHMNECRLDGEQAQKCELRALHDMDLTVDKWVKARARKTDAVDDLL